MAQVLVSNIGGAATLIGDPPNIEKLRFDYISYLAFNPLVDDD